MATEISQPTPAVVEQPQVIVYGHSSVLYWWPVWLIGYLMALVTWLHPQLVQIGDNTVEFYSKTSLGVIYVLVVVVTLLITNTSLHGSVSLIVELSVAFVALLFAYLGWWEDIFRSGRYGGERLGLKATGARGS